MTSTSTGSTVTEPPAPRVWPTLKARDARALIDFCVAAFGFVEVVAYTDDTGRVVHAELAWPAGGGVMLGEGRASDPGDEGHWPVQPGTFGGYVVCDDPDVLFARAVAAGATAVREPFEQDHGSRDCTLIDPEGNHWQFGTYRGHPVTRPA